MFGRIVAGAARPLRTAAQASPPISATTTAAILRIPMARPPTALRRGELTVRRGPPIARATAPFFARVSAGRSTASKTVVDGGAKRDPDETG